MALTNDIVPFATGTGALLEDQASYLADPRRQNGVAPGIGDPQLANKTWRQTSVVASMIAQFIVNTLQTSVMDDGNVANLLTLFEQALTIYAGAPAPASLVHGGFDTGSANNLQIAATPVIAALRAFMILEVKPNATSIDATAQNPATLTLTNTGTGANITAQVLRMDGTPIRKGDLVGGQNAQIKQLICDGANWYLQGSDRVTYWGGTDFGTADAMQVTTSPAFTSLTDGQIVNFIKGAAPNATSTPALMVNSITPAPVVTRNDGSAVVGGDLPANALIPAEYVAASSTWRLLWPITPKQVKVKLSGNLQLYVRADGNDANDGLANTSQRAFKTLQGCWNAIFGLFDPAGYTIAVNFGQGAGNGGTFGPINFYGYSGPVILAGDPTTPTQAIVSCGGQHASPVIANGPQLQIQNCVLQFDYAGTQSAIEATLDAVTNIVTLAGTVTFRNPNARSNLYEIYATGSGTQISFADNATIVADGTGSRNCFIITTSGASMIVGQSLGNVTFQSTSTIAYGTFAIASKNSSQDWSAGTYGAFTATGVQANASYVSAIVRGGKTLPGNAAPISSPSTYGVVA